MLYWSNPPYPRLFQKKKKNQRKIARKKRRGRENTHTHTRPHTPHTHILKQVFSKKETGTAIRALLQPNIILQLPAAGSVVFSQAATTVKYVKQKQKTPEKRRNTLKVLNKGSFQSCS